MMKIKNIICTCSACPSQWEIKLEDGRMIYVRYRWGALAFDISLEPTDDVYQAINGEQIYHEQIGDSMDGCLSEEQLIPYLTRAGITK